MTTKRLEFSPKTKVLACIRYNPELAEYAEGLTNEKAKELLPFLLTKMTCPGLVELHLQCGRSLADGAEFDHIMRNEIRPDNSVANCRPLCPPACHKVKTAMDAKQAAKGRRPRGENKTKRSEERHEGKVMIQT